MSILVDPLPETVIIGGRPWPINSAFYIGVLFELIMQDADLSSAEKVGQALALYFPKIPDDKQAAVDAMLWFYRCGADEPKAAGRGKGGTPKKAYCFDQDADVIYSSFYGQYRIDLAEADGLHWWKFRALFAGLSAESEIKKIMGYRTADLNGLGKTQKKSYEKMRKIYALKNSRSVESAITLEERNRRMKEYVDRRFMEVGGKG